MFDVEIAIESTVGTEVMHETFACRGSKVMFRKFHTFIILGIYVIYTTSI